MRQPPSFRIVTGAGEGKFPLGDHLIVISGALLGAVEVIGAEIGRWADPEHWFESGSDGVQLDFEGLDTVFTGFGGLIPVESEIRSGEVPEDLFKFVLITMQAGAFDVQPEFVHVRGEWLWAGSEFVEDIVEFLDRHDFFSG